MISYALCSESVQCTVKRSLVVTAQNGCDQDILITGGWVGWGGGGGTIKSCLQLIASKVIAVDVINKSHQRTENIGSISNDTARHNCPSRSSLSHSGERGGH